MGRKKKAQKPEPAKAADGRIILDGQDWNKMVAKRIDERAKKLAKEVNARRGQFAATIPLRITKMGIKASMADWNGVVNRSLEITAIAEFSTETEIAISGVLQEELVAELRRKQLVLFAKSEPDWKQRQRLEPFREAAEKLVAQDEDLKAAMEDLCTCGHKRSEHVDEYKYQADEEAPGARLIGNCEECECEAFVPLAPGEEPKPVGIHEDDVAEAEQEDVDDEIPENPNLLCVCGHALKDHDDLGEGNLVCAIGDCKCEGFEAAENDEAAEA